MIYTTYNPVTGEITGQLASDTQQSIDDNTNGESLISGYWDGKKYYVLNGEPVEFPAKLHNDKIYLFDYTLKTWAVDIVQMSRSLREFRNDLLKKLDQVNPVWYATLTSQQQTELATYRQALLDVPQQVGWPESVTWPQQPTWL